jgi:dipeptidyl aminopeptidase/acylaminoacyl peptidase
MRRTRLPLLFCLLLGMSVAGQNLDRGDGTIVDQTECPAKTEVTYDQYLASAKSNISSQIEAARKLNLKMEMPADLRNRLLSEEEFNSRKAYTGIECKRLRYLSDGLKVVGYLWKPKKTAGKKLPLIIFNRGGNRERSKLTPWMADGFYDFVSSGFVVIGSQYRGVDGGEGKEEYGGSDVRDVLNLIALARSLGYVDMNNVFMFGNSRGGMMTYLALKSGVPVRAAVVTSGVTDLFINAKEHPELVTNIYRELIPDYDKRKDEAMRERSATFWADKINVPLLIMHGTSDASIGAKGALTLAGKLQELGKQYELIMYAGDGHGLPLNRRDSDNRIVEWFRRHMK